MMAAEQAQQALAPHQQAATLGPGIANAGIAHDQCKRGPERGAAFEATLSPNAASPSVAQTSRGPAAP